MVRRETVWVVALACALAGLVGAAAWARLGVLSAWPEPVGVDGYWYAVQLRSLLEQGRTADSTLPAALWFLAPFAAALGPIGGLKLGAAIGVSLHALTAFALGRALARSSAAGLVAAAVVATSPGSIYLTTEFVKQGIALTLLAGFLAALVLARERPSGGRIAIAAVAGVAVALSHKLALAIALAALGAVLVAEVRRRPAKRRWLAALVGLGLAAAGFLAATRARWLGVFGSEAELSLPALRFPSGVALRFGHEAALAAAVAVLLIGLELARRRRGSGPLEGSPVGWTLVGLALAIALPWLAVDDPDGIGLRLRVSAHLALAPLAGLLLAALLEDGRHRAVGAIAVAVALVAMRPLAREEGVVRPNPALVAAAARVAADLPPDADLVTPDRQVAFLLTWQSRRPARTRPGDGAIGARTWRVLPRAWLDGETAAALPPGVLVALSEPAWQRALAGLSPAARRRWEQWDQSGSLPPPRRSRYHGFFGEEP
jgi:hypothetical protein